MQISLKISKVRYELFQYVKKFAFPEIFLSLCFFFHLQVHSHVDIYNFSDNTWGGRFDMPKDMAHSHLGMVTDGRFIYVVTGQYGPQCRGPTAQNFVLDTETKEWHDLPPLPVPRY